MTGIGLFLKVSTVMRPCDGTSGLVRGNRRKAVFAFKWLFPGGIHSGFHSRALSDAVFFGSAGKNRKPPSTTGFLPTKPQVAEVQNRGLVGRSRFYPTLPESLHGSMRQILGLSSTPAFSRKETAGRGVAAFKCARHVLNLPHTSDFCPCGRPCPFKTSAR